LSTRRPNRQGRGPQRWFKLPLRLIARRDRTKWESHRFYGNMPEAIQTLNGFVRSHGAFLSKEVDAGDLFRSAEPTLPGQQRTLFDLQARTLSQNTDSLALVIDGMARGWEGLAPGTGMGVTIKP
jgi:hypothetical protein